MKTQRKSYSLGDEHGREQLFLDIIYQLIDLSDKQRKDIAHEANVHWTTLYSWIAVRTFTPRIDTLSRVARALGYDIVLKRIGTKRAPVRRIK